MHKARANAEKVKTRMKKKNNFRNKRCNGRISEPFLRYIFFFSLPCVRRCVVFLKLSILICTISLWHSIFWSGRQVVTSLTFSRQLPHSSWDTSTSLKTWQSLHRVTLGGQQPAYDVDSRNNHEHGKRFTEKVTKGLCESLPGVIPRVVETEQVSSGLIVYWLTRWLLSGTLWPVIKKCFRL